MRRSLLLAVVPVVLAGAVTLAPTASSAQCAKADAWLNRDGGSRQYVTPWAPGSCVVPTPGMEEIVGPHGDFHEPIVPGPYEGVGFDSSITAP